MEWPTNTAEPHDFCGIAAEPVPDLAPFATSSRLAPADPTALATHVFVLVSGAVDGR